MNKQPTLPRSTLHEPTRHDSASKHVAGAAEYIDDIIEPEGTMHAYLALSTHASAEIVSVDFAATLAAPGVIGILGPNDVPGENDVSPNHLHDEPIFAPGMVQFWGQPLFAVVAETRDQAR
ncbi:MAG TPA: xanthine dehydrogenase molybdopterin binding subunit, partial [Devosia sp.]|nr:xanthine dehydrogenase molybdopterin binding subunit [Devosia sp.]